MRGDGIKRGLGLVVVELTIVKGNSSQGMQFYPATENMHAFGTRQSPGGKLIKYKGREEENVLEQENKRNGLDTMTMKKKYIKQVQYYTTVNDDSYRRTPAAAAAAAAAASGLAEAFCVLRNLGNVSFLCNNTDECSEVVVVVVM